MISSVYNGYIYIHMIMKQLWLSEMFVGNQSLNICSHYLTKHNHLDIFLITCIFI